MRKDSLEFFNPFSKKLTQEGIKASIELVEWSEYSHELKDVIRYLKKNGGV